MKTGHVTKRSFSAVARVVLISPLLLALPALAQDPVVTAADPPSAEQETYDLRSPSPATTSPRTRRSASW